MEEDNGDQLAGKESGGGALAAESPTFPSFGARMQAARDALLGVVNPASPMFSSPKVAHYKSAPESVAASAAQLVHLSVIGTPGASLSGRDESLNSSAHSLGQDMSNTVARRVDFAHDRSVSAGAAPAAEAQEAPPSPPITTNASAAQGRAKLLEAWKRRKEQKEQPHPAASVGKLSAALSSKLDAKRQERGSTSSQHASRRDVAGGGKNAARDLARGSSPSKRGSPAKTAGPAAIHTGDAGAAAENILHMRPAATPLLERLVRDAEVAGSLPNSSLCRDDELASNSPEFLRFASFASLSARPSSTLTIGAAGNATSKDPAAETPVKFAAFGATSGSTSPVSGVDKARDQVTATPSSRSRSRQDEMAASSLQNKPVHAGPASASCSSVATRADPSSVKRLHTSAATSAGAGVGGGGGTGGARLQAVARGKRDAVAGGVICGPDAAAGRRALKGGGGARRDVVGEAAKSKEESDALEAEYEYLTARLLQVIMALPCCHI